MLEKTDFRIIGGMTTEENRVRRVKYSPKLQLAESLSFWKKISNNLNTSSFTNKIICTKLKDKIFPQIFPDLLKKRLNRQM